MPKDEAKTTAKPTEYPFAGESAKWPRSKKLDFEGRTREKYADAYAEQEMKLNDDAKLPAAMRKFPAYCVNAGMGGGSTQNNCPCAHCTASRAVSDHVKELTGYDHMQEKPTR